MIRDRRTSELRRVDLFKVVVALILVALVALLAFVLIPRAGVQQAAPASGAGAPVSGEAASSAASGSGTAPAQAAAAIGAAKGSLPTADMPDRQNAIDVIVPALTAPASGNALRPGELLFAGTAKPGADVAILVGGEVAGVATVGEDGRWSFPFTLNAAGEYEVYVQALDASGAVAARSGPVALSIAAPSAAAVTPQFTFPANGAELPGGSVALRGTGEPGTQVEILADGMVVGVADVHADGRWEFSVDLSSGDHEFAVRPAGVEQVEPTPIIITTVAGTAVGRDAQFGVCGAGPGVDQGRTWRVGMCDTLTFISKQTGISLPALLTANPNIDDPDLIYPGQLISLPR